MTAILEIYHPLLKWAHIYIQSAILDFILAPLYIRTAKNIFPDLMFRVQFYGCVNRIFGISTALALLLVLFGFLATFQLLSMCLECCLACYLSLVLSICWTSYLACCLTCCLAVCWVCSIVYSNCGSIGLSSTFSLVREKDQSKHIHTNVFMNSNSWQTYA